MTKTRLIVLAGNPGVGKSFVAKCIQDEVGAVVLETDRIRKELFPEPTYSGEESSETYAELYRRAEASLGRGEVVVLDATFNLKMGRDRACSIAESFDAEFDIFYVTCPEKVAKERIRNRTNTLSDADCEVYDIIDEGFEPFTRPVTEIDTDRPKESVREVVLEAL